MDPERCSTENLVVGPGNIRLIAWAHDLTWGGTTQDDKQTVIQTISPILKQVASDGRPLAIGLDSLSALNFTDMQTGKFYENDTYAFKPGEFFYDLLQVVPDGSLVLGADCTPMPLDTQLLSSQVPTSVTTAGRLIGGALIASIVGGSEIANRLGSGERMSRRNVLIYLAGGVMTAMSGGSIADTLYNFSRKSQDEINLEINEGCLTGDDHNEKMYWHYMRTKIALLKQSLLVTEGILDKGIHQVSIWGDAHFYPDMAKDAAQFILQGSAAVMAELKKTCSYLMATGLVNQKQAENEVYGLVITQKTTTGDNLPILKQIGPGIDIRSFMTAS